MLQLTPTLQQDTHHTDKVSVKKRAEHCILHQTICSQEKDAESIITHTYTPAYTQLTLIY